MDSNSLCFLLSVVSIKIFSKWKILNQEKNMTINKNNSYSIESLKTNIKLSRSAIEEYLRCPLCFYLKRKNGLKSLPMIPFTLAIATDELLKNEFDIYRLNGKKHPIFVKEKLNLLVFDHININLWRSNFKGIRINHKDTNVEIFGAIDDIWINSDTGELHIVDYKSTSKSSEPSINGGGFGDSYKRQMEIYQYIFKKAGYKVSSIGYFLYVNGSKIGTFFDEKLQGNMKFKYSIISYNGNDDWVEEAIENMINCLNSEKPPCSLQHSSKICDTCNYVYNRNKI